MNDDIIITVDNSLDTAVLTIPAPTDVPVLSVIKETDVLIMVVDEEAPVLEIIQEGIAGPPGPKGDKGDPGFGEKTDLFNPSNGQTVFTLSEAPAEDSNVEMRVNGHKIYSFNRTGVTVTYTGTSYSLTTSDLVEFTYN